MTVAPLQNGGMAAGQQVALVKRLTETAGGVTPALAGNRNLPASSRDLLFG
jgi:hypothetical protein